MFDCNEQEHGHVPGNPTQIVGQQRREEPRARGQWFAHIALSRVTQGHARRRTQRASAEEAPALDVPGQVAENERGALRRRGGERPDERDLRDVVAEPVLAGHSAGEAVAKVVVAAGDVGVWVVPLVVHHLPIADVDVEVPLVALGVVFAAVR